MNEDFNVFSITYIIIHNIYYYPIMGKDIKIITKIK